MYLSINWLRDFIKIPAKLTPADIASALTRHTVEVEGVIEQSAKFTNVVVGRILEVTAHPNADRLRQTVVDIGTEKLEIVCGAPNVAAGQMVPVALVGATLPNGLEIKEAEIRGVKSRGMICAEDELGLGKDHEGIMVLDKRAKIGQSFAKYLKTEDSVLEVDNKSLSNRPDLLSHYGIARELGVIFDLPLKSYDQIIGKMEFPDKAPKLGVKIEDKQGCPRYQAVKIEGVAVKESPAWLKERLVAVGQRPISNIVDLTNYVMLEFGQPLHAFDAAKVDRISVRRAVKNETITTLDGLERILDEDDLIIVSADIPVALAGIMGGLDSGVGAGTTSIILEAANFQATVVRKTSQKLGLRSESSVRFEKSLDPNLTDLALRRFLSLLKKICPGMKLASEIYSSSEPVNNASPVVLDLDWLDRKIGQPLPRGRVTAILGRLGFGVEDDGSSLSVTTPSWRATKDVSSKEDLAEEVLRFYGYDNIASRLPVQELVVPETNEPRRLARRLKDFLAAKHALAEEYNYSFVGEDFLTKLGIDFSHHLRLANPVSEVLSLLRRSLAPGLIANIRNNQAKSDRLGFFEIGSVFSATPGAVKKEKAGDEFLPYQETRLAVAISDSSSDLFSQIKGVIVSLLQAAINPEAEPQFLALDDLPAWADAKEAAKILFRGHDLGLIAMVSTEAADNINLKKATAIAEINFDLLARLAIAAGPVRWREAPKYPAVRRDIAIVVADKVLYNDLKKEIVLASPLVVSAELFDTYSGDKLSSGEKSLAFHLEYRSDDRTLTASEVEEEEKKVLDRLQEKHAARLREF